MSAGSLVLCVLEEVWEAYQAELDVDEVYGSRWVCGGTDLQREAFARLEPGSILPGAWDANLYGVCWRWVNPYLTVREGL